MYSRLTTLTLTHIPTLFPCSIRKMNPLLLLLLAYTFSIQTIAQSTGVNTHEDFSPASPEIRGADEELKYKEEEEFQKENNFRVAEPFPAGKKSFSDQALGVSFDYDLSWTVSGIEKAEWGVLK